VRFAQLSLGFELRPKLCRYLCLHGAVIRKDLLFISATYNQGCRNVRRGGELQRSSPEIDPVIACDLN
jgi:hypothetical protein